MGMANKKREIESEVTIVNVNSKGDTVILDLRTAQPDVEESTQPRLDHIVDSLPKSEMERVGRDMAKGYMSVFQKQMQESAQALQTFLPPASPPNIIRITLTKDEYERLGKPTVFDKLNLSLKCPRKSVKKQGL
jgi:hypothetical protein